MFPDHNPMSKSWVHQAHFEEHAEYMRNKWICWAQQNIISGHALGIILESFLGNSLYVMSFKVNPLDISKPALRIQKTSTPLTNSFNSCKPRSNPWHSHCRRRRKSNLTELSFWEEQASPLNRMILPPFSSCLYLTKPSTEETKFHYPDIHKHIKDQVASRKITANLFKADHADSYITTCFDTGVCPTKVNYKKYNSTLQSTKRVAFPATLTSHFIFCQALETPAPSNTIIFML